MYSRLYLDMEENCPSKPVRRTRKADESDKARYKDYGWIDENGRITEKGKYEGELSEDCLDGNETEKHFQWRMKIYEERLRIFKEWYLEKWGPYAGFETNEKFPVRYKVK